MINFVIPMAGAGSRFAKAGYTIPKYLIEVGGKTLLEYSLQSLPLDLAKRVFFVALEDHVDQFNLQENVRRILGDVAFTIVTVPGITRGQAETVLACGEMINNDEELAIFNIDTHYVSSTQRELLLDANKKCDGVIGACLADGDKWSFAALNEEGFVVRTSEKVRISNYALTGFYHFSKGRDFVSVAHKAVESDDRAANEFYVAPLYNSLIKQGRRYVLDKVDTFIPLGTPEDIDAARSILL
ncbi:MAG TPA: glycosyltransferase family 2 protein [Pseudomonadales bacterium]|nr:glycosyltransferase family 2 protein [Pseudomonadales bacterium]